MYLLKKKPTFKDQEDIYVDKGESNREDENRDQKETETF